MNPLLEQLHDIEGLDAISSWPLAIGWWILITSGALVIILLAWLLIRQIAFRRSWKNDTLKKLNFLEKNLSDHTAKESAILLSEYLRRIALKKYSRKQCAGLAGPKWLQWLKEHDPKQFDWENKGRLLIKAPYMPAHDQVPSHQVKELIQAVREWVH